MRFEPLSYAEQKMFERELLRDLGYADEEHFFTHKADGTRTVETHWRVKTGADNQAAKALRVSQAFIDLVNDESMQPATLNDAIEGVRYKLGYGWLAWFFFKTFAIPVIKWLWNRYHSSTPEKSIGSKPQHKIGDVFTKPKSCPECGGDVEITYGVAYFCEHFHDGENPCSYGCMSG